MNRAVAAVVAARPECGQPSPVGTEATTHDAPAQATLDAIAASAGPATAEELAAPAPSLADGGELYADHVRFVHAAFTIDLTRAVRPRFRPTAACLDAEHDKLVALLRGASRRTRSDALRER